jgi:hypothetical protein
MRWNVTKGQIQASGYFDGGSLSKALDAEPGRILNRSLDDLVGTGVFADHAHMIIIIIVGSSIVGIHSMMIHLPPSTSNNCCRKARY